MNLERSGQDQPAGDLRRGEIAEWLEQELGFRPVRLEPASNDASFRRYFRVWRADGDTRVVMDAPPDKEDTGPFLQVAQLLAGCGVHVPRVDAVDRQRGFVLLEDLGSVQYLTPLRAGADPEPLYADAFAALRNIQLRGASAAQQLPPYDRAALQREMQLMPLWFCERHLQLRLEDAEHGLLAHTFELLTRAALEQPRVLVHRDYHSRNLLLLAENNPGIVDFQDALAGPLSYDLVSLLKDCYIDWPRARVERWVAQYHAGLLAAGAVAGVDAADNEAQLLRWFDWMGVQRHVKVLGIFARLWWRDGKAGYLSDLPRALQYVRDAVARYAELREFAAWLERRAVPAFAAANDRARQAAAAAGSLA